MLVPVIPEVAVSLLTTAGGSSSRCLKSGLGPTVRLWGAEAGPWEQTKSRLSLTLPSQHQSLALQGMGPLQCMLGPRGATFLLPGTTNALGSFYIFPVPDIEFLLLEPGSLYWTMVFRNQDLGMEYACYY